MDDTQDEVVVGPAGDTSSAKPPGVNAELPVEWHNDDKIFQINRDKKSGRVFFEKLAWRDDPEPSLGEDESWVPPGVRIFNEIAALNYIQKEHPKIPIPQDVSLEWTGIVEPCIQYTFVEGRNMSALSTEDAEDLREVIAQLDGFTADLHEDTSDEVRSFVGGCESLFNLDYMEDHLGKEYVAGEKYKRFEKMASEKVAAWSAEAAICFSPPLSTIVPKPWRDAYRTSKIDTGAAFPLCHGDLTRSNVIIHPTEARVLAIIDWEYAGYYPIEADTPWYSIGPVYGPKGHSVRARVDAAEAAYAQLRKLVPVGSIPEYKPARCNEDFQQKKPEEDQ